MADLRTKIRNVFSASDDFVEKKISVCGKKASVFYIDTIIEKQIVNSGLIEPLLDVKAFNNGDVISFISENVVNNANAKVLYKKTEMIEAVLSASAVLCFEGEGKALCVNAPGYSKRAITEPPTNAVIKGPREGFIEDFSTNIAELRRRLKTPELVVENFKIGRRSNTTVGLIYLNGIASKDIVKKVRERILKIDIDGLVDIYYVQMFLEEKKNSIFKQVGSAEKPDIIMAKMLEGRVAIMMDGSPLVLTIPFVFFEDVQNASDYYNHASFATFVRILRMFGAIIGVLLPAVYVATLTYHYKILPINFLISLLNAVEGLAFPPMIEILFVLFLFEILTEASVRMPKYLGMSLSIIGALVLGETAVQAGLISPPSIVSVAISGISLYALPEQLPTTSILRIVFTLLGAIAGFYGIMVGFVFLIGYLSSINSYETPYLAPYAPSVASDKKDGIIKKNLLNMKYRPKSIPNNNPIRLKGIKKGDEVE